MILMKNLFLIVILLHSSFIFADQDLHEHKAWKKLLHYGPDFLGRNRGLVDDKNFYISDNGQTDHLREMLDTIDSFTHNQNISDKSPICRFPARYYWLSTKTPLPTIDYKNCPKIKNFLEKVDGNKIILTLVQEDPMKPLSFLGDLFIRIERKAQIGKSHTELVDSCLIFKNNKLDLISCHDAIVKLPNFYRRDLYNYELDFTNNEFEMFLLHLTEFQNIKTDISILQKNRAMFFLSLISAVRPQDKFENDLISHPTPSQILRYLDEEHLIKNKTYRPSLESRVFKRLEQLSTNQIKVIKSVCLHNNFSSLEMVTIHERIEIIDSSLIFLDYIDAKKEHIIKNLSDKKERLLRLRDELTLTTKSEIYPYKILPHERHKTHRGTFKYGNFKDEGFYEGEFRYAWHDFLDRQLGWERDREIKIGTINYRYYHERKTGYLTNFTFFETTKLNFINPASKSKSYKTNVSVKRNYDDSCSNCLVPSLSLSPGYAFSFDQSQKFKIAGFIETDANIHKRYKKNPYRFGIGPSLQLTSELSSKFIFTNQFGIMNYFFTEKGTINTFFNNEFRYHFMKNAAFNIQYNKQKIYDLISFDLMWYF